VEACGIRSGDGLEHVIKAVAAGGRARCRGGEVLITPGFAKAAADHEATEGQVVLSYLMSKGMSVIPKSARTERLKENLASTELELTAEEVSAIDALEGQEGFGRMFNDPREFPGDEE